ncbi:hypothetical protein BKA57DRAFT_435265 [Linnemannia elongata]|nr:hypothetical protein BKA57DRAFT_435265 [Linnemannia elongata]
MSIGHSYLLLRVRFKAQQFYDGLLGYIANVTFMDRLRDVQRRIENQIVTSSSSYLFAHSADCQEDQDKYEDEGSGLVAVTIASEAQTGYDPQDCPRDLKLSTPALLNRLPADLASLVFRERDDDGKDIEGTSEKLWIDRGSEWRN